MIIIVILHIREGWWTKRVTNVSRAADVHLQVTIKTGNLLSDIHFALK